MKKVFLFFFLLGASALAGMLPGFMQPRIGGTSLVGWWTFNEASGNALDYSGFNQTGILNSSPTRSAGLIGAAITLNGSSSFVAANNSTLLDITGNDKPFTLAAWVNWNGSANAYTSVISQENNAGAGNGYTMLIKSSGKLAFYISGTSGVNIDGTGTFVVPTSKWTFLVYTFDGATMKTYANAVQDASQAGVYTNIATGSAFKIGSSFFVNRFFSGSIDDVRVWSKALSSNDVVSLYNTGHGAAK